MRFRTVFGPVAVAFCLALPGVGGAANLGLVETPFFRFSVRAEDGGCELLDKDAQITWRTPAGKVRFGEAMVELYGKSSRVELKACDLKPNGNELAISFHPHPLKPSELLHVWARAWPDEHTLQISFEEDNDLDIESLTLLADMLSATDAGRGSVVVPVREGLLVPADSGLSFTRKFDTYSYEGCHMAMLGVMQHGAAALLTWHDPYVVAELRSAVSDSPEGRQRLTPALRFNTTLGSFCIRVLGKGDYNAVGRAYRQVAREKGWLVKWSEKLREAPQRAKLFGAPNIKLWSALDRRMNAASTQEESARVNWTFDEAGQVAQHLKQDLQIDKALFTLGGWIHRGYDNQHPDILPAAPECGGDAGLAECARRVRQAGYVFCLHDNYQDMYRDAPSWDERFILKKPGGELVRGGRWAGGQAYLTCSQMALELAMRAQNLPRVRKLFRPEAYFIDTTYAADLHECYDPTHPLTRRDDLQWKQKLSDYARETFGIFGSEDGREWAVPHSDFFEGLSGVSGQAFHDTKLLSSLGAVEVPLFELVFHDCIAVYGKYYYDIHKSANYVLEQMCLGRTLNYHAIPPHLYWKDQKEPGPSTPQPKSGDPGVFTRADQGWAAELCPIDRFLKNTCEVLDPLNELAAQLPMTQHRFLGDDHQVQSSTFGEGAAAIRVLVNSSQQPFRDESPMGGTVELPPYGFVIEAPTFVAFHASRWAGLEYEAPVMFTLRSLDGRPLATSRRVRVYHAFGDDRVQVGSVTYRVKREAMLRY